MGLNRAFETRLHVTPVVTQSSDTRREPPLSGQNGDWVVSTCKEFAIGQAKIATDI
jgi:hypothetical protein